MSNEIEIAVQLAKLSAEVKQMSVLSDFIKVGIPSLVAIISAILTYKISTINSSTNIQIQKNNKIFDKEIENLKMDFEREKEYTNRSYIIAKELANNASVIYDAIKIYTHSINGLIHSGEKDEVTEHMKETTVKNYNTSHLIYNENKNKIMSSALLIDDEKIKKNVKLFNNTANEIFSECSPFTELSFDELIKIQEKNEKATELLFIALSSYLNIKK